MIIFLTIGLSDKCLNLYVHHLRASMLMLTDNIVSVYKFAGTKSKLLGVYYFLGREPEIFV